MYPHVFLINRYQTVYPLVNIQKTIENGYLQLIYPMKMVTFHSFLLTFTSAYLQ